MATLPKNWAILLCKFSDDPNDPATTRVMDLAAQWKATKGATFVAANLTPAWYTDNRTLLQLYQDLFTSVGVFTANIVDYYDAMSHGLFDLSGNQVFPITLDLTIAEGAALFTNPGGAAFQNDMFQRAKQVLQSEYGVDWKSFLGGVALSFQDAEGGSQGGTFDGGPGVFSDIRWVRNNGTTDLAHEFGHGFGLQHSRTDGQFTSMCTNGAPSDYTDPWDIMSAISCASFGLDPNYGMFGPGMNAWNMRAMQGLDESRIWKFPPNLNFCQTIVLNPLHHRTEQGFLGAELPGIGGQSSYLVEFRVPSIWDAAIGPPVVIVHRFLSPNSYIMKGTKGQKALQAGDTFIAGSGPLSKVTVKSIDPIAETATIEVCYSNAPVAPPVVTIEYIQAGYSSCEPNVPIEGTVAKFVFKIVGGFCNGGYQIQWNVQGAAPLAGESNSGPSYSVVLSNNSPIVTVRVEITFNDGSTPLQGAHSFQPLAADLAGFRQILCMLRERPIPWWDWDPERVVDAANDYTVVQWRELSEIGQRITQIANRAIALLK